MGIYGLFFRVLFLSPTLFIKLHYYYPTKDKLRVEFFRYNRSYSKIYDSYSSVFIQDQYKEDFLLPDAPDRDATEQRREVSRSEAFRNNFPTFYKIAVLSIFCLAKLY